MTTQAYARLHPGALAIAGGIAALIAALIAGLGMMGFGSAMSDSGMMGGGGWMSGVGDRMSGVGYGHMGFAGGFMMFIALVVVGFVTGWAVASVYNAVVGRSETAAAADRTPRPRHE